MKKLYALLFLLAIPFFVNSQIVNIPDAAFKAKLLAANSVSPFAVDFNDNQTAVDTNHDGQIQVSEALLIKKLDINGSYGPNVQHISDLTGIEAFANLESLKVLFNILHTINIGSLSHLKELDCSYNELTGLQINTLPNLEILNYSHNPAVGAVDFSSSVNLKDLDLSWNLYSALPNLPAPSNLESLKCSNNNLTTLNLSPFVHLKNLDCSANHLNSLNMSGLDLIRINCGDNPQLSAVDFSGFTNLAGLSCYNNPQISLDLSNSPHLTSLNCANSGLTGLLLNDSANLFFLYCNNNYLSTLQIPGTIYTTMFEFIEGINFENNPYLHYICVDDSMITFIQNKIDQYGYGSTCHVNSYCNFTPAGTYYVIQGNTKYDENNNGCDASDIVYLGLTLTITDGTTSGTAIANFLGGYEIPVSTGTHTISPVIENPAYFTVAPTSETVSFPTTASPFNRDFCLSANGTHNDLEVFIMPIGVARPGFDAMYKLVYKNKGTHTQSGSISLAYQDDIMDMISVNPLNTSSSSNLLSWNFSNLRPFETREISIVMNINSPVEIPAVNMGDSLQYSATIIGLTDQTPNDNTFTLNQNVINSLDPNDKTCLEGTLVSPSMVGNYVHYLIRFENTGTFAAENIVVADTIDPTKFDIASLIPESSGHSFTTRIAGDKAEFIFQNINLPFDDANNDGYVAFKIKTKPTLAIGDSFSNSASIYFDYNFPVVTDTYTTTIQSLGNSDFEFNAMFSLSPVPVKDVLTITAKKDIQIRSIGIYNSLGQLIQAHTEPNGTIDVSALKTGTYFIKLISDKGSAGGKFIKE